MRGILGDEMDGECGGREEKGMGGVMIFLQSFMT